LKKKEWTELLAIVEVVQTILGDAWFSRSWVFQEFVLSKSPEFYVGRRIIPFEVLEEAMQHCMPSFEPGHLGGLSRIKSAVGLSALLLFTGERRNTFDPLRLSNFFILVRLRQRFQKDATRKPRPSLLELLIQFRHYRLSKPRDKVYSLLNIAADHDQNDGDRIRPNYDNQCSDAECLRVAAITIIRREKDLRILRYANSHGAERVQLGKIPSWHDDIKYTDNGARMSITPGHLEFFFF
jgi:hypothetical protein